MNNERKPITRTVKGSEPWMPDQVQVRVRAWDDDRSRTVTGWLIFQYEDRSVPFQIDCGDRAHRMFKHIEPIYEPEPKKTRPMTPLEGYVFLRDGGYVWRSKDNNKDVWFGGTGFGSFNDPENCLYADPTDPDFPNWQDFPDVEVE